MDIYGISVFFFQGHVEMCRMLLDRFPKSARQLDKNDKRPLERSASQAVSEALLED